MNWRWSPELVIVFMPETSAGQPATGSGGAVGIAAPSGGACRHRYRVAGGASGALASGAREASDSYKKVPRPFAPEHPRAELLELKGLTGGFPPIPKGLIHKPGLTGWLVVHGTAMAPLVTWLHKHVG